MLETEHRLKQPSWLQKSSLHTPSRKNMFTCLQDTEIGSLVSQAQQLFAHMCARSEAQRLEFRMLPLSWSGRLCCAENRRSAALPASACSLPSGCIPSERNTLQLLGGKRGTDTHRSNRHAALINNERLGTSTCHCSGEGAVSQLLFLPRSERHEIRGES